MVEGSSGDCQGQGEVMGLIYRTHRRKLTFTPTDRSPRLLRREAVILTLRRRRLSKGNHTFTSRLL